MWQATLGRAVTGDQVVDVNSSELWVKVASDADYDATKASIENVLKDYAGLSRSVLTYEKQRIRDVGALDDRQAADVASRQLRPGRADGNRPAAARRARLRRGPRDPAAAGDTDEAAALAGRRRRRPAGGVSAQPADGGHQGESHQRPALRGQAGRRAPQGGHVAVRHPGRQRLPGGEGVRRRGACRHPMRAAA